MENKILRAAIYIRVSTAEQAMHGYSLESQKSFLLKYAESHDMAVVGIYCDEGKSARKSLKYRKQIHVLLDDMKKDAFDVVLFWKMDRWFRNVSDFYKVQEVFDQHKKRWISVAEPSCNMETRDGVLHVNIYLAIGQNESDTTSERIKFNFQNMISQGRAIHGSRLYGFGYMVQDGKVVKDPETKEITEEVFRYYMLHRNKRQTVIHIRDTYGIHFTSGNIEHMLPNPIYTGKYHHNDNYCEPYITQEEFETIQYILSHNVKKSPKDTMLFGGLLHCPVCGHRFSGTAFKKITSAGNEKKYYYYRCQSHVADASCPFKHRTSETALEKYLLENIVKELDAFIVRNTKVTETPKPTKKKRSEQKISEEMERLNLLFQKGRVSFEYYEAEYDKLSKELAPVSSEPVPAPLDYTELYNILAHLSDVYDDLSREDKKVFWHSIIKKIHVDENANCESVEFF